MKNLIAPTEDFIKLERTELNADATAGSNVTLVLKNNNGMAEDSYIVVGFEGSELAEMCLINQAVSGNTDVRVATLKFNHKKDEPITVYAFNKRKFYGATSATGSFVELTSDGSPKDIQVDDPQGTLLEYTGSTYTHFKSTYYNVELGTETDIDDAIAVLGDQSLRYATIYAIRKHAGLAGNPFYSDFRIETKRKQAENEIDSAIYSRYRLPLEEVPALLGQICELLAAGYIDFEEFGSEGEGVKWLGEARAILSQIQKGTRILIGADGIELDKNSSRSGSVSGYPNETVSTTGNEGILFKMSDKF